MRRRTWSLSCFGSRWMSLARCETASRTSSLTRTTASPVTGSRLAAGMTASVSHLLFSSYVFRVEGARARRVDGAPFARGLAGEAAPAAVEDEDVAGERPRRAREELAEIDLDLLRLGGLGPAESLAEPH